MDFFSIPDPGIKKAPDPDPKHCCLPYFFCIILHLQQPRCTLLENADFDTEIPDPDPKHCCLLYVFYIILHVQEPRCTLLKNADFLQVGGLLGDRSVRRRCSHSGQKDWSLRHK
jgi:hypothetical protein